jgi:Flp pilus assembly protein TadG
MRKLSCRVVQKLPKHEAGLALVEFVMVGVLVFLPLFLAVTEIGMRYYQHNTLTKAVQVAGRYYAMQCADKGHQVAYDGAIEFLRANIQTLLVKDGSLTLPSTNYVRERVTIMGYKNDMETPCTTDVASYLSCEESLECVFIKIKSPDGKNYQFGTWVDENTITVTERILR